MTDFKLPELGENVASGDVLRVLVKPGDVIVKDQSVLELETDKATVEVPSSVAGQVKEIRVKAGETVTVGQVILTVDDNGARPSAAVASAPAPAAALAPVPDPPREEEPSPAAAKAETKIPEKVVAINRGARVVSEPASSELPVAPASPSVRRLARELGVNIDQVAGSGLEGRISIDDVKAHAKRLLAGTGGDATPSAEPLPDFSRWGDIDRQRMRQIRKKTAEHVSAAWSTVPHVTQHDVADITALEDLRQKYAPRVEADGGKLTMTAIAVKVAASALKAFPQVNVSLDMAAGEIIYKKYVHIGVAVDTDRGLLVPVIRNADAKSLKQISRELAELAEKARARKLSLDEMQGGSFSISNLGGIGGTAFTPIVNVPEVAILGISRARREPVWNGTEFQPRLMLPLALAYDHRAVDGADGIRFLRWIVEALEQPFLLLL
jgi:pyruvate dehydrogenase E2 component (dihydrolipoamide acetyltransferase)